jgi:hypothetical protein
LIIILLFDSVTNNFYNRGRKLDKERFTSIHIHQKYNVPNRGRDKGLIARNVLSNKRQGKLFAT